MVTRTSNPWHLSNEPVDAGIGAGGGWYVKDSSGENIAVVFGDHDTPEHASTARLIAAAPDLLENVRSLVALLDVAFDYDGDVFRLKHDQALDIDYEARALIAKIEGESVME